MPERHKIAGEVFNCGLPADPGCLFGCLEATDDYYDHRKIISRMGQASGLSDPERRMHEEAYRLASSDKSSSRDVSILLTHNEYLSEGFDVLGFIAGELERGLEEGSVPRFYSGALADIPIRSRIEPYVVLLSKDLEGKLLEILPFGSSTYFGSDEEGFAPAYHEEIEVIRTVSESLPKDDRFAYHRKYLEKIIQAKEHETERERWRSFHESI